VETFIVFGSIVAIVFISKYFKAIEKGHVKPLQLGRQGTAELEAVKKERDGLEARVRNLETIVCAIDLELNARLNRLAQQQSSMALAPRAQAVGSLAVGANAPTAAVRLVPERGSRETATGIHSGEVLLGRYTIERELGRGGMGAVFLARDSQLGELVALKLIASHLAGDSASVERFRREVSAARKITHENVIRIHDLGEVDGNPFLSMEYFSGMTLADLLARRGALEPDEGMALCAQIVAGLGAAHQAGVVHRDLKPQNVLVDERRRVKLIDFGLAKASFMEGMTATGLILGTPEYMSPEQIRGERVDARTDVYALGALTYRVLTGEPPFRGDSPIAIGFAHCTARPRAPRELCPALSEAVERGILRALEKLPGDRPATVQAFWRLCRGEVE
jgi:serine/threonine-protein kinase